MQERVYNLYERDVILTPNRNIWRLERAERAAILIDAGRYFGALRDTLIKARSSVFVIGWDLDSRTRLVGENGTPADGYPETFVEFLSALVRERPQLMVHLLVWDYSILYAFEREPFPTMSLGWRTPQRIRYCLDDDLPPGASHHQKIVVVDDAVAFCGGLDVTIRRWDTTEHRLHDPRRVDPLGWPYRPFHDVQAMVDGTAALALAELARERWARGVCPDAPPLQPMGDPWPHTVTPDFRSIEIGIARTCPAGEDTEEIREIEAVIFDAIDAASRTIYIENQFITSARIAQRLAQRMVEQPALETVIVVPQAHHSWLEAQVMRAGRNRFMQILESAAVVDRVALLCPRVSEDGRDVDVMVHSKLMLVDDVLMLIGSANLNNRSIGLDTECDLAIAAHDAKQRRALRHMRDHLLGHHCGVGADTVAASLAHTGSIVTSALALRRDGHYLQRIEDGSGTSAPALTTLAILADPERAIPPPTFLQSILGRRPRGRALWRLAKIVSTAIAVVILMLVWRFTPLAALAQPDNLRQWLYSIAQIPGAFLIVLAAFVGGGLVVFPVLVLIAATAAAFGPWLGFVYAMIGAVASAIVTYVIGAALGGEILETLLGPRLNRMRRSIVKRGVFAVAAIRLVPIAPFTLVNLAAGASKVRFDDYLFGTVLGMVPGITLMSVLGYQIWSIMLEPTLLTTLLLLLAVAAWLTVSLGAQAVILRRRRRVA